MSYTEQGDFLNQPFSPVELKREHKEVELARRGRLRIRRKDHPVTVGKRYRFRDGLIELAVELKNEAAAGLELWYGLELNLALPSKDGKDIRILSIRGSQRKELGAERAEAEKLDGLLVRDLRNSVAINLVADPVFLLWSLPVETVSYPPQGRTRQYQASCFVLSWKLALEPGARWNVKVGLQLQKE